jgi:hypothetical protein
MNFKFYATSAPKTFLRYWLYASNRPSHAMIQISKFREDKIISMFYACYLHVLCIVLMSVIHPIVGSIMLVETITVLSGMSISRRDFYVVPKLILFIQLLISMQCRCKNFFNSIHPIGHHVPWFKFHIYEFLFFSKKYSQWILNRAQKCQESNGEKCFWIECFVKELSWKNGRD